MTSLLSPTKGMPNEKNSKSESVVFQAIVKKRYEQEEY